MFGSSKNKSHNHGFYQSSKIHKSTSRKQPSFRSQNASHKADRSFTKADIHAAPPIPPSLHSAIVTISVGPTQRLFAAHEEVLTQSPYFIELLRKHYFTHTPDSPTHAGSNAKRIDLPHQEAEIFSSVLEYLYKGDYYPRLEYDKRRKTYSLEDGESAGTTGATIWHNGVEDNVLKDTVIYVRFIHPNDLQTS